MAYCSTGHEQRVVVLAVQFGQGESWHPPVPDGDHASHTGALHAVELPDVGEGEHGGVLEDCPAINEVIRLSHEEGGGAGVAGHTPDMHYRGGTVMGTAGSRGLKG